MRLGLRNMTVRPPSAVFLTYHRVIPRENITNSCSLEDIIVYEESFRKEMAFLSAHYRVISLEAFIAARDEGRALPVKTAVITFDDGWEDNYQYAFPVLKEFGLPATIFLTSEYIGTQELFWPEKVIHLIRRLTSLKGSVDSFISGLQAGMVRNAFSSLEKGAGGRSLSKCINGLKFALPQEREALIRELEDASDTSSYPAGNSFLSWPQVLEMAGSGISFGSHGAAHRILTECTGESLREELVRSRRDIELRLKGPVTLLAYPNGDFNRAVIAEAKKSGYRAAVTVEPGMNSGGSDLFRLKRIHMHERRCIGPDGEFSPELFAFSLAGFF